MFKTFIEVIPSNIDEDTQKILVPFLAAYEIQVVVLQTTVLLQTPEEFDTEPPYINWKGEPKLQQDDKIILHLDYHYKKSAYDPVLVAIGDSIASETFFINNTDKKIFDKRKEIIIKHLVNGLFAFDAGLYKEAVLNFGTLLEAILNVKLINSNLKELISSISNDHYLAVCKEHMHELKDKRNKVHPNKIKQLGDITQSEAYRCRKIINEIISLILRHNGY